MEIVLDKAIYQENTKVTGYVLITQEHPYHSTIYLKFKAKEQLSWLRIQDKSLRQFQARVTWFNHQIQLYKDTSLPPSLKIPFSFQLNPIHPVSYQHEIVTHIPVQKEDAVDQMDPQPTKQALLKALSQTKVKAYFPQANLKATQYLRIIQGQSRIENLEALSVVKEKTFETKSCLSKGRFRLKVEMRRNFYAPGESVSVYVSIDNSEGAGAVGPLECRLRRLVAVKNHFGEKRVFVRDESVQAWRLECSVARGARVDGQEHVLALKDALESSCHLKNIIDCYELWVHGLTCVLYVYQKKDDDEGTVLDLANKDPMLIKWLNEYYYESKKKDQNLPAWEAGLIFKSK